MHFKIFFFIPNYSKEYKQVVLSVLWLFEITTVLNNLCLWPDLKAPSVPPFLQSQFGCLHLQWSSFLWSPDLDFLVPFLVRLPQAKSMGKLAGKFASYLGKSLPPVQCSQPLCTLATLLPATGTPLPSLAVLALLFCSHLCTFSKSCCACDKPFWALTHPCTLSLSLTVFALQFPCHFHTLLKSLIVLSLYLPSHVGTLSGLAATSLNPVTLPTPFATSRQQQPPIQTLPTCACPPTQPQSLICLSACLQAT